MLQGRLQNGGPIDSRGTLPAPLDLEDETVIRALKKKHADLPLAASTGVYVRREVVRGVDPQLQPLERESLDSSQRSL